MHLTSPLVSILMPVYNAHEYLVGALDSIRAQTYENWELIAIDDCSADDSFLTLAEYERIDPRIKAYKNMSNLGVGKTLDKAVRMARGEFIARMDADDSSYPDRFEKQVKFLLENPDVVALGGQVRLMDEKGKIFGVKTFPTDSNKLYIRLYTGVPIQHPTLMINKTKLPADFGWYGGWKKAQDLYLFFQLVKYGKLANLDDFVLDYRFYSDSNSLKSPKDTYHITKQIRAEAKSKFGYKPTFSSKLIELGQDILVYILPDFLIRSFFKLIRAGKDRFIRKEYVTEISNVYSEAKHSLVKIFD
jgi:glycosyltransferase involved in cell wall biosynthesis